VPILSDQSLFQRLALVEASSARVAFGQDKFEALAEYRKLLVSSGNKVAPTFQKFTKTIKGTVKRFAADTQNGVTTYYLLLREVPTKLFTGTSKVSEELPLVRDGDRVKVIFVETTEGLVQMEGFDLLGMAFSKSEVQKASDQIKEKAVEESRTMESAEEMKRRIQNMGPEELKRLLEQQKSK